MEIIDQKILHDSVRWPNSPMYKYTPLPGEIKKKAAYAGDIVMANETGEKRFVSRTEYEASRDVYASVGFEPIAIVAVPASHTKDGTARCVALKAASYGDLEHGQPDDYQDYTDTIYWNCSSYSSSIDIPSLPNFSNGFNYIVPGSTTISCSSYVYLAQDPLEPGVSEYYNSRYTSPYGADGISKNPQWDIEGGLCEEMDGEFNTNEIIKNTLEKYIYRDSINKEGDRYETSPAHHAAVLCFRYHSTGTKQGEWYLPAIGEFAYLLTRKYRIFTSFVACGGDERVYNYMYGGNTCWTSTEVNKTTAYAISVSNNAYCKPYGKSASNAVLPFIKI